MKAFIALFLAVAVSAEADPQLLLNSPYTYGASPFYSSLMHHTAGLTYSSPHAYGMAPLAYAWAPRYHAKSAEGVEHIVAKREADAEAEADPFLMYGAGFYGGYSAGFAPYTAAYAPYTTGYTTYAHAPVAYAMAPRYYAKSAEGVEHIVAKREAEAEADPFLLYGSGLYNYGVNSYNYRTAAWPYASTYSAYGSPYGYNTFPRTFGYSSYYL